MAYLHGFQNDVFISYSHIDNQPFGEEQKSWVSEFHKNLQILIQFHLGSPTTVWRDAKLEGADILSAEIVSQLKGTAVMVSVLSPGYIRSEWCRREVQEFLEAASASGGFRVGNKERIVKVIKTPVKREDLPEILDAMLGHEFYRVEGGTERTRELLLDPSPEARRAYWAKVDDVAQEIRKLLDMIRGRKVAAESMPSTVYLAETTSDLQRERDKLRRELQDRSYQVLPSRPLPWNAADCINAVRADLEGSSLSIHLLGARYGLVPEGENRSLVALQNDLAAERQPKDFSRVLWVPLGLEVREDRQKKFIDDIRQYSSARNGFELLETSLENLKTVVLDKLRDGHKPAVASETQDAPIRIYLVCDPGDRSDVRALRSYLAEKGFEVSLPLSRGDVTQMREDHKENLLLCDGVILYWGCGDEFWLRAKLRDLARAPGLGRSKPFLAKAIYATAPSSLEKEDLQTHEALVIRHFEGFSPAALEPFVAQLQKRKGAAR